MRSNQPWSIGLPTQAARQGGYYHTDVILRALLGGSKEEGMRFMMLQVRSIPPLFPANNFAGYIKYVMLVVQAPGGASSEWL